MKFGLLKPTKAVDKSKVKSSKNSQHLQPRLKMPAKLVVDPSKQYKSLRMQNKVGLS